MVGHLLVAELPATTKLLIRDMERSNTSITSSKSSTRKTKTYITYTTCNTFTTFGYTLIEILVGLTIIGLLFGVGSVNFRDFSRREALKGAVKQIQGDLRLTQSLASSGEKPISSSCNSPDLLDSYGFRVSSASSNYSIEAYCTGSLTAVNIKTVTIPSGITVSNPNPNPIKFKVLGQGTNISAGSSAVITVTQAGTNSQATVTVTSGGEIR